MKVDCLHIPGYRIRVKTKRGKKKKKENPILAILEKTSKTKVLKILLSRIKKSDLYTNHMTGFSASVAASWNMRLRWYLRPEKFQG